MLKFKLLYTLYAVYWYLLHASSCIIKLYLKYYARCFKPFKLPEVRVVISSKPSRKSTCFIARSICINIVGFVDVVPTQLVGQCSLCVVASIHVFLCSSNGVFVEKLSFVLCTT